MRQLPAVALLCALFLCSCGHPYRVSRGAMNKLIRQQKSFVVVFGSLAMEQDAAVAPTIRFVHQATRTAPVYVLHSITISSGDRFYAILQAPAALARLDEFYSEVGDGAAYDRIAYVRLPQSDEPHALYVGEIRVTPAQDRTARGQTLAVNIRDDYENAGRELHRLYPRVSGSMAKMPLLRAPVPMPAPPPRVK